MGSRLLRALAFCFTTSHLDLPTTPLSPVGLCPVCKTRRSKQKANKREQAGPWLLLLKLLLLGHTPTATCLKLLLLPGVLAAAALDVARRTRIRHGSTRDPTTETSGSLAPSQPSTKEATKKRYQKNNKNSAGYFTCGRMRG